MVIAGLQMLPYGHGRALFLIVSTAYATKKNGGFSPPFDLRIDERNYFSNCRTLCCDWLASASADTAIDCRVDNAWLLAASSLVSASVRLEAPVCSTLIRFLEKSWRICTIDRFEPRFDASVRSVEAAELSWLRTPSAELLSRKSVPAASGARLRPAVLKVTPW